MPTVLQPVQTTDLYVPGQGFFFPVTEAAGVPYSAGYLVIAPVNSSSPTTGVFVSVLVGRNQGEALWQEEIPVPPGVLPLNIQALSGEPDYIYGVRARNLISGTNALVSGALYQPGEVVLIPQAGGGFGAPFNPTPLGNVLQTYGGNSPASDFSWTGGGGVIHTTNFPTNTAFNKLSPTSLLLCHLEGDFTPGASAPDVISMGLQIDGGDTQTVGHHVSDPSTFFSVDLSRFIGVGGSGFAPLPAGAHTIETRAWNLVNQTIVARTSNAWNLEIIEMEVFGTVNVGTLEVTDGVTTLTGINELDLISSLKVVSGGAGIANISVASIDGGSA